MKGKSETDCANCVACKKEIKRLYELIEEKNIELDAALTRLKDAWEVSEAVTVGEFIKKRTAATKKQQPVISC